MYLCPVIRVRRLGGSQKCPTGSCVLMQPAYLLQPDHSCDSSVPSQWWLCCFFSSPSLHCRASARRFCRNQMLLWGWPHLASLPFHFWLNSSWSSLWRLVHATSFLFLATPRHCETAVDLPSFISPVYRKSESIRVRQTIWYVCAASLNWKRIYSAIFITSDTNTTHVCQVLSVSCLRWVMSKVFKIPFKTSRFHYRPLPFSLLYKSHCSNCVTPFEL